MTPYGTVAPEAATTASQVQCPACGWRQAVGQLSCQSCWQSLAGAPILELKPEASEPVTIQAVHQRPRKTFGKSWLLVSVAAIGGFLWQHNRPVRFAPGMLIGSPPNQSAASGKAPWVLQDGTRVVPLASYQIKARLLHRERYRFDAMADLSPVDFCVGWHQMSDQSMIDRFQFSNNRRFLTFTTPDRQDAELQAASMANMHLLPAADDVREAILALNTGALFEAQGYLVSVHRPGMNPWSSSLTREDSGQGACEIMWVEEFHEIQPSTRNNH